MLNFKHFSIFKYLKFIFKKLINLQNQCARSVVAEIWADLSSANTIGRNSCGVIIEYPYLESLYQRLISLYEEYDLRTIREIEPVKHVTILDSRSNEDKIKNIVQG